MKRRYERGAISGAMIAVILLSVALVAVGGLSAWLYMQYKEQKTDVDAKIEMAADEARNEQAKEDEKKFILREKEPRRQFVGPKDYGRVTFEYPKTWSVYESVDGSRRNGYEAYLNRILVPPVSSDTQYALRVSIQDRAYDAIVGRYEGDIKRGRLKLSNIRINDAPAVRLDGEVGRDMQGSMAVFKIRDKTVIIRTDSPVFRADFDHVIKTLKFNQ